MNRFAISVRVATIVLVCHLSLIAAQFSMVTVKSVSSGGFSPGKSVPKWRGRYLLSLQRLNGIRDKYDVIAYGREGAELLKVRVDLAGAVNVSIQSATANEAGEIALAGVAVSNLGARSGFVARIASSGNVEKIIQTADYFPHTVEYALAESTLWTLGEVQAADSSRERAPDHPILRSFTRDGTQQIECLPRSSFKTVPSYLHPAGNTSFGRAQIGVGRDHLFVVSPSAREIIKLDLSGNVLQRSGVSIDSSLRRSDVKVYELVFLSEKEVWTFDQEQNILKLDTASGIWSSPNSTPVESPGLLVGRDFDKLVYFDKYSHKLTWATISTH